MKQGAFFGGEISNSSSWKGAFSLALQRDFAPTVNVAVSFVNQPSQTKPNQTKRERKTMKDRNNCNCYSCVCERGVKRDMFQLPLLYPTITETLTIILDNLLCTFGERKENTAAFTIPVLPRQVKDGFVFVSALTSLESEFVRKRDLLRGLMLKIVKDLDVELSVPDALPAKYLALVNHVKFCNLMCDIIDQTFLHEVIVKKAIGRFKNPSLSFEVDLVNFFQTTNGSEEEKGEEKGEEVKIHLYVRPKSPSPINSRNMPSDEAIQTMVSLGLSKAVLFQPT